MKSTFIFLITFINVFTSSPKLSEAVKSEQLSYTIYIKAGFIWIAIGDMKMITTEDVHNTSIHLTAKTYKKWRHIHELEIDIKSVMDNETGLSSSYVRHSIENGITIKDSIEFDQSNLQAHEVIKESDQEANSYSIPLENNVVDILTSFHSMRQSIAKGKVDDKLLQYILFYNRLEYDFGFTYVREEHKKIRKIGKRDCSLITANAIKGRYFEKKNKLKIWIGNDAQALPYMFESPLKLGKIKVVIRKEN